MKIFRPTDQLFLWTLLVNQLVWSNPPASITAQETTEQKLINMVNKAPIPLITFVIICWLCITESVHSLCRDGADAQYILFIEMNNDNYPPSALCTRAPAWRETKKWQHTREHPHMQAEISQKNPLQDHVSVFNSAFTQHRSSIDSSEEVQANFCNSYDSSEAKFLQNRIGLLVSAQTPHHRGGGSGHEASASCPAPTRMNKSTSHVADSIWERGLIVAGVVRWCVTSLPQFKSERNGSLLCVTEQVCISLPWSLEEITSSSSYPPFWRAWMRIKIILDKLGWCSLVLPSTK